MMPGRGEGDAGVGPPQRRPDAARDPPGVALGADPPFFGEGALPGLDIRRPGCSVPLLSQATMPPVSMP